MNIKTIQLVGAFSHENTEVKLPPTGVVLVTGPNGAGKSSLIEAPCVALWGETLRGSSPWQDGLSDGEVRIETDSGLVASRKRKSKRTTLAWQKGGDMEHVAYENTTKSQDALEHVVGSFDVWRRSRIFSSQDASHFTLATDAERKRLLESILGLDKFDAALERCRNDRKDGEKRLQLTQLSLQRTEGELRSLKARVDDANKGLATFDQDLDVADTRAAAAKVKELKDLLGSSDEEQASLRKALREIDQSVGGLSAEVRGHQLRLDQIGDKSVCFACGQTIDPKIRKTLLAELAKEKARIGKERARADEQSSGLQEQLADLEGERKLLSDKLRTLEGKLSKALALGEQRKHYEQLLEKLRKSFDVLEAEFKLTAHGMEMDSKNLAELEACEVVLGVRGVRSHILGQAMVGVEVVANNWLKVLSPSKPLKLSLKATTEKKTGGVSDAISIQVEGAGGGTGYKGASGGERRRIDVALIFGFAAVSLNPLEADANTRLGGGPQPLTSGTLFFDEVFDALDEEGVVAVSGALNDLAKDRAVVVVSHSEALASALHPVLHLKVAEGGKVQ